MAGSDTLTGKKVKETYTKLLQLNSENELLDGVGGQVSPIISSATVTGNLNVNGTLYKNGVEIGTSDDNFWSQNSEGEIYRSSNIGIGEDNPEAKVTVRTENDTDDFFLLKRRTAGAHGGYSEETIFKIDKDGAMTLAGSSTAPTPQKGMFYYNTTEDEFYLGYDN
tara:strand:- start:4452 stop:4949 length:498 start_codon:yes stop_codon:yes gene_type:complete